MRIQLNRAHFPVTVLGPGRRAAIWVQGCSIGCAGCASRDTWAPDPTRAIAVDDLLGWLVDLGDGLDGVTLTGGEPFDQPEGLGELVRGIRALPSARTLDVLCFSGYPLATLRRRHPTVLDILDAVVTGPFLRHRADDLPLRGSANQVLTTLTELGGRRYDAAALAALPRGFQVEADGDTIFFVGIPRPGGLPALEALMHQRGVRIAEPSWRA